MKRKNLLAFCASATVLLVSSTIAIEAAEARGMRGGGGGMRGGGGGFSRGGGGMSRPSTGARPSRPSNGPGMRSGSKGNLSANAGRNQVNGGGNRNDIGGGRNQVNGGGNGNDIGGGNRGDIGSGNNSGNINIGNDINIGNGSGNVGNGGNYRYGGDHVSRPIYRPYAPVARAVVAGAAIATSAAIIGSYYSVLPSDCMYRPYSSLTYYYCGDDWYQPVYEGTDVKYVVVESPE